MDELSEATQANSAGRSGRSAVLRLDWPKRRLRVAVDGTSGTSRRGFLRASGGYAAGVATVVGVPAALLLEADADAAAPAGKAIANPTSPVPNEPVMAYVHDAKRGTVVIMHGEVERTVQDFALVDKLLHTPKKPKKRAKAKRKLTTMKGS